MDKFACILVDSNESFGDLMKENEKFGIERGLKASLDTELHSKLTSMFNKLSTKGYHVTGFILDKDNGIEFLFQRDKNQTTKLKEQEIKDKYVL